MTESSMLQQTLSCFFLLLFTFGCASSSKPVEPPVTYPFYNLAPSVHSEKLWSLKVAGLLTDLNLSKDGSTVLVATVPDHDSLDPHANRSEHYASLYSKAGKLLAQFAMPAQIKSQTLSADGQLAVIATYDDELRAYNREGKLLWETEASCKPILMNLQKKVICFHDDDAEPELGFEVLDWRGKRLSNYPIKDDALVLKIAADEKSFIMALTHGRVVVFDSRFKPVLKKTVPGEVVDVAASSSAIAILYNEKKSAMQKAAVFKLNGNAKSAVIPVSEHADQIEISPDGNAVFGYSNTNDGQVLMRLSQKHGEAWNRKDPKSAQYSSQLMVASDTVWVGFQDSHVLGFDFSGGLKINIQAPAEESAFLYSFGVAPKAHEVVVGTDDGRLSLFQ
jgi:hypothetical protein